MRTRGAARAPSGYYELARFVPREQVDAEIVEVLDRILAVASAASPADGQDSAR